MTVVLEGFSCVVSCCVTSGGGYKMIFGSGTRLIVDTSKFISTLKLHVIASLFIFIIFACIAIVCKLSMSLPRH